MELIETWCLSVPFGAFAKERKMKRKKKSLPETGKLEEWTFYRKTEILGLLRVLVVLAFVIQLMVEFGPQTVAH
jgi:hypothetical protein